MNKTGLIWSICCLALLAFMFLVANAWGFKRYEPVPIAELTPQQKLYHYQSQIDVDQMVRGQPADISAWITTQNGRRRHWWGLVYPDGFWYLMGPDGRSTFGWVDK